MSRVYETILVLMLLSTLVFGLSWLLLDHNTGWVSDSILTFPYSHSPIPQDPWLLYLPLLCSVMSLLGVVAMGICTPLGVSHLFTVLGAVITSPKVHTLTPSHPHISTSELTPSPLQPTTNVREELAEVVMEEKTLLEQREGGRGEGGRGEGGRGEGGRGEGERTLAQVQHRKAQLGRSPW